jgi:hypothetical protein
MGCGVTNGVLNILSQLNEYPKHPLQWSRVWKAVGKGAVTGGIGGLAIGAYADYRNSQIEPVDTDAILSTLVNRIRLKDNDARYVRLCAKADWLIQKITGKFGWAIKSEPFRFGSTESGTALKEKFDIDVTVSFRHDAFGTIKDMYNIIEDYLNTLCGSNGIISVRQQKVSIGVLFDIGNGSAGKVDVVPVKITNKRGNRTAGYIHKNGAGLLGIDSYQKTDTTLLKKQRLSSVQKEILIILKNWKRKERIPISSHLLETFMRDAFCCNTGRMPPDKTNKTIMVLSHIRDYIETGTITSVENSNNRLTDIPDFAKSTIKNACKRVIEEFEYQPNSIVQYFQ